MIDFATTPIDTTHANAAPTNSPHPSATSTAAASLATPDPTQAEQILRSIEQDPMGGWFHLDSFLDPHEYKRIKSAASRIQTDSNYLVCIGIGGSYLGHRAIIEALKPEGITKVLYAGNSMSARALAEIMEEIGESDFSVLVISKSGTTMEPAVAFRIFKKKLIDKYGPSRYKSRIYVTTDDQKGALYNEAIREEYERFVVPDNLGGRYSVLSAVGLLPLAVAGVDIDALLAGARAEAKALQDLRQRPAELPSSAPLRYAFARHALREKGVDVEVLATFEPNLHYFEEWWKQLFGESEGKEGQGIFPASVIYSTDLHSLGQYMQQGRRNIFETMLKIKEQKQNIKVPAFVDNTDGLKYLEGKQLSEIEDKIFSATASAHRAGGIEVLEITIEKLDAENLGQLIYFFEVACAVSAKLAGINPFDQPGVEAYKFEMFRLLGRE